MSGVPRKGFTRVLTNICNGHALSVHSCFALRATIVWRYGILITPSTHADGRPELPMRVTCVRTHIVCSRVDEVRISPVQDNNHQLVICIIGGVGDYKDRIPWPRYFKPCGTSLQPISAPFLVTAFSPIPDMGASAQS